MHQLNVATLTMVHEMHCKDGVLCTLNGMTVHMRDRTLICDFNNAMQVRLVEALK